MTRSEEEKEDGDGQPEMVEGGEERKREENVPLSHWQLHRKYTRGAGGSVRIQEREDEEKEQD